MGLGVLITDGQERSAVAACHALRHAGYRVGAAGSSTPAAAHWSRACDERFRVPDPRDDDTGFAEQVAEIAAGRGFETVIPATDAAMLALSRHREAFDGGTDRGMPARDVVDAAMRKVDLHEKAVGVGLDSPTTIVCESPRDAHAAAGELGFPVLMKPPCSIVSRNGTLRQIGSFMISDGTALDRRLAEFGLPCLLQRRDGGRLISFGGVVAEDRLLGAVVSRYRRTWPQDAGSVSCSETVAAPELLVEKVGDLMVDMGWQGIFELELIQSGPRTYAAIDLNPRLYGSLALAVRAGVPLPAIWCDWLLKGRDGWQVAEPGFHYRWEDAELCNLVTFLRQGRVRAAASMLQPRRHTAHAQFRWSDPGPLLARALNLLRRFVSSLRRSRRPEPSIPPQASRRPSREQSVTR